MKSVDLRLGQRVGALGLDRVLGGHHEERARNLAALRADRDLALLHHLEQRRLHLGRRAVDLVGEQEVAEDGAELRVERPGVGAVDAGADEVARHEVRGELDAPELRVERVGEGPDRQGLGEARHALEEQVPAGQECDEHALEHRVLADDDTPDLEEDSFRGFARIGVVVAGERAGSKGRFGHVTSSTRGRGRSWDVDVGGGTESSGVGQFRQPVGVP